MGDVPVAGPPVADVPGADVPAVLAVLAVLAVAVPPPGERAARRAGVRAGGGAVRPPAGRGGTARRGDDLYVTDTRLELRNP